MNGNLILRVFLLMKEAGFPPASIVMAGSLTFVGMIQWDFATDFREYTIVMTQTVSNIYGKLDHHIDTSRAAEHELDKRVTVLESTNSFYRLPKSGDMTAPATGNLN